MKINKSYFPYLLLGLIISIIYYKLFLFGKIPFPGDLLVVGYSPWFDYYKFPIHNPQISDAFSQFFLWKHLAIESLRNFKWPLWNPYSFTGTPLLATYHSATLYPLNILLLLPKHFGWGLYIYSQTLIASITFYLFISQIVKSKIAGLAGAIIFALGGLMTTWLELGTAGHAMAWIPLALYSIKKFSSGQKFRFVLVLTASLSLIILSGNAQITTYSFSIVFLYSLWVKSFPLLLALVIPLGITALQLLPSFDLLNNSIRQTESYTQAANFGLLNIKDGLKFFIPDYFGNAVTRNYWGTLNYLETSAFFGTLSLPLLLYAFFKVRSRDAFFFLSIFFISLLFVFDNPISRFLYSIKIPLLTSSYAGRMLFLTLLCVSVLSSLAINHIARHKDFVFCQKITLWAWSAILGIILGTLLTYHLVGNILIQAPNETYLQVYLTSNDYLLQNFIVAIKNSILPFGLSTIILCLLVILNISRLQFLVKHKLNIFLSVFFILVILDFGRYFLKFNPFVPSNLIFPNIPTIDFLQKQEGLFRIGREHAEVLPPNTWTAYNLQSYEGYDPVYLNQYGKFMHFLNGGDIRTGNSTRYAEVAANYKSPYLDSANTKYLIAILRDKNGRVPGDQLNYRFKESNYKLVFKDRSSAILENPDVKDRVHFAKKIIFASTQEIENKFMTDKNFDPRETIMLSDNLHIATVSGQGSAKITHYSPNTVKVQTNTSSEEILILADQYETSWKVRIDGKTTPISPANLIFRAVKVPAGTHEIVFRYWPKSFDIGLKISLSTIFVLSLITLITLKIKRF